jgi:hypothetical protein
MSEEIKELYGTWINYVEVNFQIKYFSPPMYSVTGLGGEIGTFSKEIWREMGGAEGIFIYELEGDVEYPEQWKGRKCRLKVDSSIYSVGKSLGWLKRGYLGSGTFNGKEILLTLTVKPHISRDILDYLYLFTNRDSHVNFIRCHLVNLMIPKWWTDGNIPPHWSGSTTFIAFEIARIYLHQDLWVNFEII